MTVTPLQKVALVIALATLAAGSAAAAVASSERASASLDLRADLRLTVRGGCPVSGSADACAARTGEGAVAGLGAVTESYEQMWDRGAPSCSSGYDQALPTFVSFVVAGKGEIHFALEASGCVSQSDFIGKDTQAYTITGGTGIYTGASGTGTVKRYLNNTGERGRENWTGTLEVPGLEFDVTRPTFTGATNKTVKARKGAKSARVVFRVTATDDRDGTLPVTCFPRSGSAFPIGRTPVTCSAVDTSGNTARASFTVTVQRRR